MTFEPLTPERRRAMTRRYLLDAAEIVFTRNGFHGSTLDEVAATAGFTKGAVYSNFKSKDDLFLELVDDRIERQFAVVTEVLESSPHSAAEQLPRIRELLQGGTFFWDETWLTLYLEFLLYARRNPEAKAKLVARAQRESDVAQHLIEREYAARGERPNHSTRELAVIALALFNGLGMDRLVDPTRVTNETLDTTLSILYDAIGVNDPDVSAERTRTSTRRVPRAVPRR